MEKLLAGDGDVEDLNRLFLGLRERFYSRQAFQEIGHFAAHADERIMGVVSNRLKDFFVNLRHSLPVIVKQPGYEIDGRQAGRTLRAALNLCSDDDLPCRPEQARSLIGRIERKIEKLTSTGGVVNSPLTDNERALFDHLTGYLRVRPVFTGDDLFREFGDVLMRNRLLDPDELQGLEQARPFVVAYGGWRMHLCNVRLGDGDHAHLQLAQDEGKLAVWAGASIGVKDGQIWSMAIYDAEIELSAVLSPEMLAMSEWDFPLTIGPDRLIAPL